MYPAPCGFHPAVVETEYHRLHHEMLCKRIISEALKSSKEADALIDKYNEQGSISDDDMIELLKEYMRAMIQIGMRVLTTAYSPVY